MRSILRVLLAIAVVAVVAVLALALLPVAPTPAGPAPAADWKPAPGQGRYVAQMADCTACHTAPGGKPFAGGRAIESPFGVIYSSNITPDRSAGIGGWTLDQFRAALVDGVAPGKHWLYPAMPYENYRAMTEEDIRAVFDHLRTEVQPVAERPQPTRLGFPFNQRWGIRAWNWLALDKPGFHPADKVGADPRLRRGAYLVQALGHCGACHSPRNALYAQDGLTAASPSFLTGGELGDWIAPDLRGAKSAPQVWSADELKAFLRTGRNAHAGTTGEMVLAIEHSLAWLSDDDANAITAYLRAIGAGAGRPDAAATATTAGGPAAGPAGGPDQADVVARLAATTDPTAKKLASAAGLSEGERLFLDNCAACHFVDGRGAPGVFPSLAGNSLVNSAKPQALVQTILHGAAMPSTPLRPQRIAMPGFAERLDDAEVAALASFVRQAWGNASPAVAASLVGTVRNAGPPPGR